jgi:uncharacterized protein (DUF2235 family)
MKRLVLCCDGTWNSADQVVEGAPCPTNVVRLAYRVAKSDGDIKQVIYYSQGVGTGNSIDRFSGGAFGSGVEDNIFDAYRFLIANYETGDQLYLFGFSRGAFTARSIAGMIRKCGILKRNDVNRYREALELYRSDDDPDAPQPMKFREDFAIDGLTSTPIAFIGVWDTVGALGIPIRGLRSLTRRKHQFHDTELSGSVKHAAHALAIDERRAPFEPATWRYKPKPGQTVRQAWFPGVHSDVGAGYPDRALGDIALQWMMQQAQAAGLAFQPLAAQHALAPSALGKLHNSKTGLYYLTLGQDRTIGKSTASIRGQAEAPEHVDPTQSLHPSALERWDADPTYRPPGMRDFLKLIGDARGTAP